MTWSKRKGRAERRRSTAMPETALCRAATVTTCYYKVYIRTDTSSLKHDQETLPIIPGMTAQVDI